MAKRSARTGNQAPAADPTEDRNDAPVATDAATDAAAPAADPTDTQAPTDAAGSGAIDEVQMVVGDKAIWDAAGNRCNPGDVVSLPVEAAKKLDKAGKAKAYNPLLQD